MDEVLIVYGSILGNNSNHSSTPGPTVYDGLCEKPSDDSQSLLKSLAVIYMLSSLSSIVGSMSIIIYTSCKRIVWCPEIHPLFHLSLADFFLAFGWFLTTILWWVHRDSDPENSKYCLYLEIVTEVFHIASFFLTVNYAAHVYIRIKQRAKESVLQAGVVYQKLFFVLYGVSWVLPVFLMLPMVLHFKNKNFLDCSKCLLLFDRPKARLYDKTGHEITKLDNFGWRNYGSLVLILTLGVSIALLLVLYFAAMKKFTRVIKRSGLLSIQQRELIESNKRRVMLYVVVFFVCWLPAFVVAFVDIGTEDKKDYNFKKMYFVFLIEGILTPAQGFFNSLVYGWTRNSFRLAGQGRTSYRQALITPGFTTSTYGTSGREA